MRSMKQLFALAALFSCGIADAQVYTLFGPSAGIMKGATTSYQTSSATSADVTTLFVGTNCSASNQLQFDGNCLSLAAPPAIGATTPSTGKFTSLTATSLNGNTFTTGTYTLTGVAGKTFTFNNSLTLAGTDATTITFPSVSTTILVQGNYGGSLNTGAGTNALTAENANNGGTAFGTNALSLLTTGTGNSGFGVDALQNNITGSYNAALGYLAAVNVTGSYSTAIGAYALNVATGTTNTALGYQAGTVISSGSGNTIIGANVASTTLTTGSNNVVVGNSANCTTSAAGTSDEVDLCTSSTPLIKITGGSAPTTSVPTIHGTANLPDLASSSAAQTGTVCWTTGTGRLTVDTTTTCLLSTLRVKQDIHTLPEGLHTVMALRPVRYHLKKENNPENLGEQLGLIAEEVQKIDPRLVALDTEGLPRGVRYQQLTAVLVKAIQEQQQEINILKRQLNHEFITQTVH